MTCLHLTKNQDQERQQNKQLPTEAYTPTWQHPPQHMPQVQRMTPPHLGICGPSHCRQSHQWSRRTVGSQTNFFRRVSRSGKVRPPAADVQPPAYAQVCTDRRRVGIWKDALRPLRWRTIG